MDENEGSTVIAAVEIAQETPKSITEMKMAEVAVSLAMTTRDFLVPLNFF